MDDIERKRIRAQIRIVAKERDKIYEPGRDYEMAFDDLDREDKAEWIKHNAEIQALRKELNSTY